MSEKNKTIQEKITELSDLVQWFQGPDFSLEESVEKFKKAEELAEVIESELMSLKNDIEIVKKRFDSKE